MPGPSDANYGYQQPPLVAAPRGPSPIPRGPLPAAGFSQAPAGQPMMPGFSQPSSNNYPVAAPRSEPVAMGYSQPVPQVNLPPQPAGEHYASLQCQHYAVLRVMNDE